MLTSDIRHLIRAQPFAPFVMHLVNGERHEVHHHDFLWIPENSRTTVNLVDRDGREYLINTGLILKIEWPPAGAKKKD